MKFLMRLKTNWRYIYKKSLTIVSSVLSTIGVLSAIYSFDGIYNRDLQGILNLLVSLLGFIMVVVAFVVIYVIFKKKSILLPLNENHSVYGIYGDILNLNKQNIINVVIPVNRCFDTIVDNQLISENTLHGKLLKKIYKEKHYTEIELNNMIQAELGARNERFVQLNESVKKAGNLRRFPTGTIVTIRIDNINYFLLGFTELDSDLHASISKQEYLESLVAIFNYIEIHSQGFSTYIPLIGGGHSSAYKDGQSILDFLVKFIQLNKDMINCDINIVVNESSRDSISIL